MNFDPLPDADNAAVGSQNDFFRRHCQTQCLIFFASTPPWRLPQKPRKSRMGFRGLRAPLFNQAAMQRSIGGTTFGRYIKLMHKYTYEKGNRHYENSINNRWK